MPFDPHVPFAASSSMTAFGRRNPRGAVIADRAAQIGAVRECHPLDIVWRLKKPAKHHSQVRRNRDCPRRPAMLKVVARI
ncbi:hypothetical protein KDW63_00185 [Burkholderia cenocepacia]|nr:hypothetical protein [Burkholderia cenocepacia]